MKSGDLVKCIGVNDIVVNTGEKRPHPKVGDILTVIDVDYLGVIGFIRLKEYGQRWGFESKNFKRI
jgi:hypothetical protein